MELFGAIMDVVQAALLVYLCWEVYKLKTGK